MKMKLKKQGENCIEKSRPLSKSELQKGVSYCSKIITSLQAKLQQLQDQKHNIENSIKNIEHELTVMETKRNALKQTIINNQ